MARGRDVGGRLTEAHETDRARIARALHDDIGQRLAALTMDLDGLAKALPLPATKARVRVRALHDRCFELTRDIEALSHNLHPTTLKYLGVASASAGYCRELSAREGIGIAFSQDGIPDGVPADVALCVFRVLQEAVTNAVKHSGVSLVAVALTGRPDEIRVEIVDDGIGFNVDAVLRGRGVGLLGIQERVRMLGGKLVIRSGIGRGTAIRARVPINGATTQPSQRSQKKSVWRRRVVP